MQHCAIHCLSGLLTHCLCLLVYVGLSNCAAQFGGGMFGGGGGRGERGPRGKQKGEDVVFPLKVTLEDLYNGTSKKLRLTKSIICSQCAGKGGKGEATCRDCKGHGVKLVIRQLGPGMIQQMQTACSTCRGTGNVMAEKDKCKKCRYDNTCTHLHTHTLTRSVHVSAHSTINSHARKRPVEPATPRARSTFSIHSTQTSSTLC